MSFVIAFTGVASYGARAPNHSSATRMPLLYNVSTGKPSVRIRPLISNRGIIVNVTPSTSRSDTTTDVCALSRPAKPAESVAAPTQYVPGVTRDKGKVPGRRDKLIGPSDPRYALEVVVEPPPARFESEIETALGGCPVRESITRPRIW